MLTPSLLTDALCNPDGLTPDRLTYACDRLQMQTEDTSMSFANAAEQDAHLMVLANAAEHRTADAISENDVKEKAEAEANAAKTAPRLSGIAILRQFESNSRDQCGATIPFESPFAGEPTFEPPFAGDPRLARDPAAEALADEARDAFLAAATPEQKKQRLATARTADLAVARLCAKVAQPSSTRVYPERVIEIPVRCADFRFAARSLHPACLAFACRDRSAAVPTSLFEYTSSSSALSAIAGETPTWTRRVCNSSIAFCARPSGTPHHARRPPLLPRK